jgi:hypothetical protein
MNQQLITRALIALSAHTIGTKEAAVLFSSIGGWTAANLTRVIGGKPSVIKSRLQSLIAKNLIYVESKYNGVATYAPSAKGRELISEIVTAANHE